MDETSSSARNDGEQELSFRLERVQVRLTAMRLRTLHDVERIQRVLRESRAMVEESKRLIRRSRKLP